MNGGVPTDEPEPPTVLPEELPPVGMPGTEGIAEPTEPMAELTWLVAFSVVDCTS